MTALASIAEQQGSPRAVRRGWIRACIVGELFGFIPPAVTGAALFLLDAPEAVMVAGLVTAGVGEGLILGKAQATVIERALPPVSGWTGATALAAGLAWLAGMGGSSLVQAVGGAGLIVAIPGWILGLLSMGYLQSRRLRPFVEGSHRWIAITTLAWLVGVAVPVIALSVVPNGWHALVHVVVAVAAAVAMGATVGAISAGTLQRFVTAAETPPD